MVWYSDPIILVGVAISAFVTILYIVSIISWSHRKRDLKDEELPGVSIIVPAYNEGENIAETIESLLSLNYPREKLEIIVVDDGSTDNTYETAKAYESRGVVVIRKENGGKGSALNVGIKRAKHNIVACMDADSISHPDAMRKIVKYFEDKNVWAVIPAMHVQNKEGLVEKFQWAEYMLINTIKIALDELNAQYVTPGPFATYRKEFFEKYGGFDEKNITEDLEVALRIIDRGGIIAHAPDAIVYTKVPNRLQALVWQRVRWNLGFVDNVARYRHLVFNPKHGDLGVFVLPSVVIGLGITFYTAAKAVWELLKSLKATTITLLEGGPQVILDAMIWRARYALDNVWFRILGIPPIAWAATALIIIMVAMIVTYARRREAISWLGILLFTSFYFPFTVVVWTITLWIKLFGGPTRFGGVRWENSVLERYLRRSTSGQQP